MFSIHDFIMTTIQGMVGKYPDFQVREFSLNWYSKAKIAEQDLATVEEWLNPTVAEEVPNEEVGEQEAEQE